MVRRTTDRPKETAEVGVGPAIDVWTGQYKKSWNGIITPESFSHPAKFARGLIETIVDHALEEGWVKPGDQCIDPFGGIATGAYACITKGLRWTGVELEEHFHNLGQGCDCTGISKHDYARLYGRWPRMRYAHGHYICPRCLAQVAQVTGERRPVQRLFRTVPQAGRAVKTRTVAFLPLPFPDRRDGVRPPPRAQALFAQETASYARSSGVIPCTQPHHYTGNIEAWEAKGYTGATLLKGDSRNFCAIIQAHADLAVSSSPYAQSLSDATSRIDWSKAKGNPAGFHTPGKGDIPANYGASPDNLGNFRPGSLDAALAPGADLSVASPVYGAALSESQNMRDTDKAHLRERGRNPDSPGQVYPRQYSASPDNLANLPTGSLDLATSSPPAADGGTHTGGADPQPQHVQGGPLRWVAYGVDASIASPPWQDQEPSHAQADTPSSRKLRAEAAAVRGQAFLSAEYGHANGQLGNAQGDTFWSAAKTIISETYKLLRPGAHAIWVTKMYIRDGQLVEFPGDWMRLAEHCGFQTVHIHLAMLVERRVETHLFEGAVTYEQWTESFFRRLGRKKTGLGIEFETVICMVKPLPPTTMPPDEAWQQLPLVEVGVGADLTVSSPSYGGNEKSDYLLSADGKTRQRDEKRGYAQGHGCFRGSETYGQEAGQLGAMPVGSLDATLSVSSSPYNLPMSQDHNGSKGGRRGTTPSETGAFVKYGSTPGQLEGMAPGSVDLALSSSPYAGAGEVLGTHNGIDWTKAQAQTGQRLTPGRGMYRYSSNPDNLGTMREGATPQKGAPDATSPHRP